MSTVCVVCGRPADQFRDVVEVVDMKVRVICRPCDAARRADDSVPAPIAGGQERTRRVPQATQRVNPQPPSTSSWTAAIVLSCLAAAAVGFLAWRQLSSADATAPVVVPPAPIDAGPAARAAVDAGVDGGDRAPPAEGLDAVLDGEWVHPLAGPFRELPTNEVQRYGSYRARDEFFSRFCGSGHCGVDIGVVVGLPVLAVRDGIVDKVVYNPTQLEGKYIRLEHPGQVYSYYMHLDQVLPGLEKGSRVDAGAMIGTLGRTGIKHSAPHLHFMITFLWQGKEERYVDPEPKLRDARLVEIDPIPEWAKPSE